MRNSIDYIIVGTGYAGLFMAHQLLKNNKKFIIFGDGEKSASEVSAGMINPAILKKFTTFWLAQEQIDSLKETLLEIENYTGKNYFIDQPVHRIFHDENEKNLWIKKSVDPVLSQFLSSDFKVYSEVKNPFGTGKVLQSGRLDVQSFFTDMKRFLHQNGNLVEERFRYEDLNVDHTIYHDIVYKNIIFCEGIAVKNNPFFADIPIHPNKGHHLKVKLSKPLSEGETLKKKHFLFPLHHNQYYYGGTYDRDQLNQEIDGSAVEQLKFGLSEFYPENFEIEEVNFGFRPTVKDRRPILGQHSQHKNLYVFNGLGARGILNANYFSQELYHLIENGTALHPEIDIDRFS